MKKHLNTTYVLVGIGLISLVISVIALLSGGTLTEQWTGLFFGVALIVVGLSLNDQSKTT